MAWLRTVILIVLTLALGLAPAVASATSTLGHSTSGTESVTSAEAPLPCHAGKPAAASTAKKTCKHCAEKAACTSDLCAVKCFKIVGDIAAAAFARSRLALSEPPAIFRVPVDRNLRPAAPPPRT
ncbi:MAG: hypothetical protein ACT4N2_07715 [Hyphomicrobium sp.]